MTQTSDRQVTSAQPDYRGELYVADKVGGAPLSWRARARTVARESIERHFGGETPYAPTYLTALADRDAQTVNKP